MTSTIVDQLYIEYLRLVTFLDENKEPSLRISVNETFRKALLLSAASYFELKVTQSIIDFCNEQSSNNSILTEFVKNKALKRQYHTLFDWDKNNANHFLALFGNDFKDLIVESIKANDKLDIAVKAFLEIGRERNCLVHQDYGSFTMEKTAEEIFKMYQDALYFVEYMPEMFRVLINSRVNKETST